MLFGTALAGALDDVFVQRDGAVFPPPHWFSRVPVAAPERAQTARVDGEQEYSGRQTHVRQSWTDAANVLFHIVNGVISAAARRRSLPPSRR